MPNILIQPALSASKRVKLMQESASFDIADAEAPSHEGRSSGKPPKVPKVFVTNHCLFDCQYCGMRASQEKCTRYVNTPRQVAEDAVNAARSNGHCVFISSSIYRNADYTEELIVETLRILRRELYYRGYVHAKIMPGADPKLIEQAGYLADRISVNIELPKSEGYLTIAQQKNRQNILAPMGFISNKIKESKKFARSGQTTQIMAGAMGENDRTLIVLAEALYKKYSLRRVYYSPFSVPSHQPECLSDSPTPKWRTRRLYQADRLLQNYGFEAEEVLPQDAPFLEQDLDPKAAWALRHLEMYPVEVNTADYEALIRVPGLGIDSAAKIIRDRRDHKITHSDLQKMGVWMNRARFFITCDGKYEGKVEAEDMNHLYSSDYAVERFGDLFGSEALRSILKEETKEQDNLNGIFPIDC